MTDKLLPSMDIFVPAPLDAYETAKPGEPTFTLQGGDPLGAPLVRVWAILARVQSGMSASIAHTALEPAIKAACSAASQSRQESEALLLRATEAEKVSWVMDEYLKGTAIEEREVAKLPHEFERLDVYDIRRRCAALISNFFSELNEYKIELMKHGFIIENDELDNAIYGSIAGLQSILRHIEIRKAL